MGYKTEINYILKASFAGEGAEMKKSFRGDNFSVTKSGLRTYVIDSPIMFADHNWQILGMCKIVEAKVYSDQTLLRAQILTIFTKEESEVVTRLIQEAEKVKDK